MTTTENLAQITDDLDGVHNRLKKLHVDYAIECEYHEHCQPQPELSAEEKDELYRIALNLGRLACEIRKIPGVDAPKRTP